MTLSKMLRSLDWPSSYERQREHDGVHHIERDLHFRPGPFTEVIARYRKERGK